MAVEHHYYHPTTPAGPGFDTVIADSVTAANVRAISMRAATGDPAAWELVVEDPDAAYDFVGYKWWYIVETTAPADDQIIGFYLIGDQEIGRGQGGSTYRTGAERVWFLTLDDLSAILGLRIIDPADADGNRPAETAAERLTWLLTTNYLRDIEDKGLIDWTALDVDMDANDYRKQAGGSILQDIAAKCSVNYWAYWHEADWVSALAMFDFNTSDLYESTAKISNLLADQLSDPSVIHEPFMEARLRRSPNRLGAGQIVDGDGVTAYATDLDTSYEFGFVDRISPSPWIKTVPQAEAHAERLLETFDEQDEMLTNVRILVPREQVNDIRHGHKLQVKFTHLPGYEDWRWVRVVSRSVSLPENQDVRQYELVLELSPMTPDVLPFEGILVQDTGGNLDGNTVQFPEDPGPNGTYIAYVTRRDAGLPNPPNGFTLIARVATPDNRRSAGLYIRHYVVGDDAITPAGGGFWTTTLGDRMSIIQYAGHWIVDQSATLSATGSHPVVSVTADDSARMLVGVVALDYGTTTITGTTPDTDVVEEYDDDNYGNDPWHWAAYKPLTAGGAETIGVTFAPSGSYGIAAVAASLIRTS